MSDVKVKLKGALKQPTVEITGHSEAPTAVAEQPQAAVQATPVPAPMPKPAVSVGFSNEEVAEMVAAGIADMSRHKFSTPMPADFQQSVDAYSTKHALLAERMLGTEDSPLETIVASAVPDIRRVAAPFRAQLAKLAEEYTTDAYGRPSGELTKMGYEGRVRAIESELQKVLQETVFGPLERGLQASEQRYNSFTKITPPTAEQRLEATAIAAELPHLTPAHALPRVAEVLRDAIQKEDFGIVRALLPYLKTRLEEKGTSYYGNEDVFTMVKAMESCLKTYGHAFSEVRMAQVDTLKYELNALKQMVRDSKGDLNNAVGFHATAGDGESPNSFIRGKARTSFRKPLNMKAGL